jgi:hypothetical protein
MLNAETKLVRKRTEREESTKRISNMVLKQKVFFSTIVQPHCNEISFMCYFSGNCATSVLISTFMCLWAIYIFPGSVHILSCSRIVRPIVEMVYNAHRHMNVALGLWPCNSFAGILCFQFSALVLCSAEHTKRNGLAFAKNIFCQ